MSVAIGPRSITDKERNLKNPPFYPRVEIREFEDRGCFRLYPWHHPSNKRDEEG